MIKVCHCVCGACGNNQKYQPPQEITPIRNREWEKVFEQFEELQKLLEKNLKTSNATNS